jgi:hypothetical protein
VRTPWLKMQSAALTRAAAGSFGSTMILINVVAAALPPC